MATNTTNFNLKKPGYSDTADIADINGNMDKVDVSLNGLADAVAIVANNNTHAAITTGQYVYVHGHGSLAEGLYTAKSNIAANATLSTSNLQADGSGGLNALHSKLAKQTSDNISTHSSITTITSKIVKKSLDAIVIALDITIGNNAIPAWSVIATSNDIKPTEAMTTTVTIANVTASQMVFCSYLNFATDGNVTIPVALNANTRYIIRAIGI